jgi:hypothetical protein
VTQMSDTLLHFSAEENPILTTNSSLALNVERCIVTLVGDRCVLAQSQFSRGAFRLLILLLKSPAGCSYAELFACLFCPEAVFQRIVKAQPQQVADILESYTVNWKERLKTLAAKGPLIYERELKRIRRLLKEKNSVSAIFAEQGFGLTVRVLYRKGYVLRSSQHGYSTTLYAGGRKMLCGTRSRDI